MFFLGKKYKNFSDEALLQDIIDGKTKAFDELYSRYASKMHYYFYRLLYQDREKANDFTQDLFMKIVEKPERFDTSRKFSTWIYTVAGNMCKNEYRKNSRRPIRQSMAEHISDIPENTSLAKGLGYYLPESIDQDLFKHYLDSAIDELEKEHRQCFVLRYQQELSINEISEIVGCPAGTVKSRLHYSLKKISAKMTVFNSTKKKEHHEKRTG